MKKGQLGNLQGLVAVLIVVGALIASGFIALGEFADQLDDNPATVTNETVSDATNVTEHGVQVSRANATGFNLFSISEVVSKNATGNFWVTLGSGNYSSNATGFVFFASTDATDVANFNNTVWNVSYSYQGGKQTFTSVIDTMDAIDTIGDLLPLIILIGMVVIILFLIFVLPINRSAGA